ncbi:MAG: hypothetical protein HC822_22225 [Oscillochloris sp.]|nr:hypothetical protein [Oscillochloris sp.]
MKDPTAEGRPYILHTTDETYIEEIDNLSFIAPHHVVALRNSLGKLAVYSHWASGDDRVLREEQEHEYYDYSTIGGRLELENRAADAGPLYRQLADQLAAAEQSELRAPLPPSLRIIQSEARAAYLRSVRPQLYLPFVAGVS